ncbi:MAG: TRIC cation channel family protein [Eggerthellaceae bacterium]|jgi:uncharacterized membrane protein YeiH|nr:TRIC cation channel family protein [Eggerthellaceae bacterium]MDR2721560.1 TRIC cation channel family protein [Coriobacteriaceae bacterium]
MLEVVLEIPFWLELTAALTGGISGAMYAVRARYDIFGTICIACTAGLFGGIMRDLLLQDYGIYAFQKPELIVCCVVAGIVVFYFGRLVSYLDPVINLLDSLSCGFWAIISVGKGLSAGLDIVPAIILGTVTAVGGGVMRDVFMSKQPEVFQAGALYGSASLFGSAAFAVLKHYHLLEHWAPFICIGLVLAVRYASLFFGWYSHPPTDHYSDVVTKTVSKPMRFAARKLHIPEDEAKRVARKLRFPKSKIRQKLKAKPPSRTDDDLK